MFANAFVIFIVAVLAILAFHEIFRYRHAARDPEALPYPRRRLLRRLSVALLFIGAMLITGFWPRGASPSLQLALLTAMGFMLLLAIGLLLRDLHETSKSVVAYSADLDRLSAEQLRELMEREKKQHPPKI